MGLLTGFKSLFSRSSVKSTHSLWLMEPKAMATRIERMNAVSGRAQAGIATGLQPGAGTHQKMEGDIAIVGLFGMMLPHVSLIDELIAEFFGESSTSTLATTDLIYQFADDDSVQGIMIPVDSPGGVSTGIAELGDAIRYAATQKPVHAYSPGLAASAGYWAPAQSSRFTIGRTAQAGSIGAYTVVYDVSKAFAAVGYEANVISTGGVKGAGVTGAKLTEEQRADIQRNIDSLGALFVDAVALGRKISIDDAKKLATGQVWTGSEAVELGLADAVETEEQAIAALRQSIAATASTITTPAPTAASTISTAPAAASLAANSSRGSNMNVKDILAKLEAGEAIAADEIAFLKKETAPAEPPIEARTDIPEDVRAQLAAERSEREKLAVEVASLKAKEQRQRYLAEASTLKHVPGLTVEEIADQLQAVDTGDEARASKLRQHFATVNAAMKSSKMFETFGSSAAPGDATPMGQLKAKAAALKTADASLTDAAAFAKACELNPELYVAARKGD